MKLSAMTVDLRREIARRFRERNIPGYVGLINRSWIRHHIKCVRRGKTNGFTGTNK